MRHADGEPESRNVRRILIACAVVALIALAWLVPRLGWSPATQPRLVVLYGYSTMDEVMQEAIIPRFREHWRRERGEQVEFVTTFAGSGEITDRILNRVPAEIAIVSSELDAFRMPIPWMSWRRLPHQGVLARTPLVFVVRKGNPKGITGFESLADSGVSLIHSDPVSSGLANLAILAEYGSALRESGDREVAFRQLLGIWKNVTVRLPSAREAHRHFDTGAGDVVVTYEQDAIRRSSDSISRTDVIYPRRTIMAEPVVTIIDANVTAKQRPLIEAFVDYLWSDDAQQLLVDYGFRSVLETTDDHDRHPQIEEAFLLQDLGGATAARREILDAVWTDRVLPQLGG